MLLPGDPVPSFHARSPGNASYSFDSVAGRYVVVTVIGGATLPGVGEYLRALYEDRRFFDDRFASLFIVSNDAGDEAAGRLTDRYPGIRIFWDEDRALIRRFGCLQNDGVTAQRVSLTTWILDPGLRVLRLLPITDLATHHEVLFAALAELTPPCDDFASWAPVLQVPNVLEPDFCRELIAYSAREGMEDSGYMKTDPATGQTIAVVDHQHKRRSDCSIEDEGLRARLQSRVQRRLIPQIERAFQFRATRMERYIVSCYEAQTSGHFRAHKDNTTLGTAHRRFAVSIGLNAEAYEGGDLRFPEYGMRTYRPQTGGAIVFSCSLLHEALPVTRGRRYVVLPFLYDEAAAQLRLENARHLQDPELRQSVIESVTVRG